MGIIESSPGGTPSPNETVQLLAGNSTILKQQGGFYPLRVLLNMAAAAFFRLEA